MCGASKFIAFCFIFIVVSPAIAGAAPTVIRTGGPTAPGEKKVAIVASDHNLYGEPFRVVAAGGKTLYRGHLKPADGFHRPWRLAYHADFSVLSGPARVRILTQGLRSRPWTIRPEGSGPLILRLLKFLETNRDGTGTALLHGRSHMNDAFVPGRGRMDLTGGWMDAGDMIHFTQTTGLLAEQLQAAARMAPRQAIALNAEADVGLRWLVKAHPLGSDLFIAQVGDERDHDLGFRDPATDDASGLPGIAVRRGYAGVGSDVSGKVAAAFAMAADRGSGVASRNVLLRLAKEWYEAGRAAARPLAKLPDPSGGFYLEKSWRDDMAGGAAALYRTTGEEAYLDQALEYLAGSHGVNGIGWSDNATFAAADLCGALGAPGLGSFTQRQRACGRVADAARDAIYNMHQDAFGMAGYLTWGTTAENAAFGAAAALATRRALEKGSLVAAVSARDWMLGRNPWGASFVAGYGSRSPENLHHWATVFGKGLPEGAVVGGPAPVRDILGENLRRRTRPFDRFSTNRAAYEDLRVDYVTSEPAIDYNGASILMLAALTRSGNKGGPATGPP